MIKTDRLLLRRWRDQDIEDYAALNADARVMQFFPSTYSVEESSLQIERFNKSIDDLNLGFWAAELLETGRFIGFIGLNSQPSGLPISPCVEIGWRLAADVWRQGLASEGAIAVLKYAFIELELDEVVSFTSTLNVASQGVMKKIGMHKQAATFFHPRVDSASPLAEHVVYRLSRQVWQKYNDLNC